VIESEGQHEVRRNDDRARRSRRVRRRHGGAGRERHVRHYQSGDPAQAEVKIEKEPGRTTAYRHSGGNTAIVTQGTGNPQEMPDWLRKQQGH
jgi:hypothetical protein